MHKIWGKSNVDLNISFLCDLKLVRPNYPFTHWQMAVANGEAAFCVTDFSQGEIQCRGEISMDTSIRTKEYPWQFPK